MANRQPIQNQLLEYVKQHEDDDLETSTTNSGNPLINKDASQTIGPKGFMVMQDYRFFDQLQHFDRERIPERVVHAKGRRFQFTSASPTTSPITQLKSFPASVTH
ncbi:catalase [Holotrichia oblita]|uniref:Catalase n=1 Tax=Holotrichia oblita TaxID=644536 RepID=A0ACB9T0I6_HOLOL|nr:catalase [Holotrichia oblita]